MRANPTNSGRRRASCRSGAWLRALLLALLIAAPALAQQNRRESSAQRQLFSQIDGIVKQLSEITGLRARHPVGHSIIDRSELKSFLEKRVHEEIKPEEIRIEQLLLYKLGFVPEKFDLRATMIDLYTEQAAAFYDFRRKKLFVLDSGDALTQRVALVHELAHALADQHFHLKRYLDRAGDNDDGALARMAVVEGQATWLMSETLARQAGKSLLTSPETFDRMSRMASNAEGQYPVFDKAPLYIRESLLFPYASGMRFQQAVLQKYGRRGFSLVFQKPPATTRNILHPDTYLTEPAPRKPRFPSLRGQRGYKKLAEGILGEFDFELLLREYAGKEFSRRIAPGWRAGAYRLLRHKRDAHVVLIHVSRWNSPATAAAFFREYRKVLEGKWRDARFTTAGSEDYRGSGGGGHFAVHLDGSLVYSVEGMASATDRGPWPKPRPPRPRP